MMANAALVEVDRRAPSHGYVRWRTEVSQRTAHCAPVLYKPESMFRSMGDSHETTFDDSRHRRAQRYGP